MEVLMEQFYTGNIDLFIAEKSIFEAYEKQGAFLQQYHPKNLFYRNH